MVSHESQSKDSHSLQRAHWSLGLVLLAPPRFGHLAPAGGSMQLYLELETGYWEGEDSAGDRFGEPVGAEVEVVQPS